MDRGCVIIPVHPLGPMREVSRREIMGYMNHVEHLFGFLPSVN